MVGSQQTIEKQLIVEQVVLLFHNLSQVLLYSYPEPILPIVCRSFYLCTIEMLWFRFLLESES